MTTTNTKLTATQSAKLAALRAEADMHGDSATVALVDAAIAGDSAARATLKVAARAARAQTTGLSSTRAPRQSRRQYGPQIDHPWAHDE